MLCGYAFLFLVTAVCASQSFKNYKLLRVNQDDLPEHSDLDVWRETHSTLDVMVSPETFLNLREGPLKNANYDVLMHDVQMAIDNNNSPKLRGNIGRSGQTPSKDSFFDDFQTLSSFEEQTNILAAEHPELVTVVDLGSSWEGRTISAIELRFPKQSSETPTILLLGGIHAREWISPMTVFYVAKKLLDKFQEDTANDIYSFNWKFIPVLNVDGYVHSWEHNRMWRKNRRNVTSTCIGVDPNRNWDKAWKKVSNPCKEIYSGVGPFSEPEVQAARKYIDSQDNLAAYFDIHSYGQVLLPPWAFKTEPSKDAAEQNALCRRMVDAIASVHGQKYTYGANELPNDMGTSPDWVYDQGKSIHSMTIELRDSGSYGFLLPRSQIKPTGEEIFAAMTTTASFLIGKGEEDTSLIQIGTGAAVGVAGVFMIAAVVWTIQFRKRRRRYRRVDTLSDTSETSEDSF